MNDRQRLRQEVEKQVKRMKRAERERDTLMAQTVFLGTLGLVFVLPIILGLYLGLWLDEKSAGYSEHWTLSLLFLGILIGAVNVYLLVRGK